MRKPVFQPWVSFALTSVHRAFFHLNTRLLITTVEINYIENSGKYYIPNYRQITEKFMFLASGETAKHFVLCDNHCLVYFSTKINSIIKILPVEHRRLSCKFGTRFARVLQESDDLQFDPYFQDSAKNLQSSLIIGIRLVFSWTKSTLLFVANEEHKHAL